MPRSVHGDWRVAPDRTDPIDILMATDRGRLKSLLPIRYGRMLTSPFAFLRGAAAVMAADLGSTPVTGLRVQACGDAHIANFGGFATPERRDVFDLNDFDETLPAPWEWDIKRLAASIVVAGRENNLSRADQHGATATAVRAYRERLHFLGRTPTLEAWYTSVALGELVEMAVPRHRRRIERQVTKREHRRTDVVDIRTLARTGQGELRIRDEPPLIYHPRKPSERALTHTMRAAHARYRTTLATNSATLLDRFRLVDVAMKVVGVGSVGTRCGIVLYQAGPGDLLMLQIKEARASVLAPHAGKSRYANNGERVVVGQRLMQAASDIFLGWASSRDGRQYYLRQLRDGKIKPLIESYDAEELTQYAAACGWALAGAHARTGDAIQIAGYVGKSGRFDDSLARFAERYADQTERDHAALVAAVRHGRVAAETNPTKV